MRTCYFIRLSDVAIAIADLVVFDGVYWITRLNVPVAYRRMGHGTTLLKQILEDADKYGITLRLEVSSSGTMNNGRLARWYAKHGFVRESGTRIMERRVTCSQQR